MYWFRSPTGKKFESDDLIDNRRKAIWLLSRLKVVNVIDIHSDTSGYAGNVYKSDTGVYIWSPSRANRLDHRDQTYLGVPQSYLNRDGTVEKAVGEIIAPFNVFRK